MDTAIRNFKRGNMNDFEQRATKWLKEFDYFINYSNAELTYIKFSHYNAGENYPDITCIKSLDGNERCQLKSNCGMKLFLHIESGMMQFPHPDIEKYIHAIKHYSDICCNNHPAI